jgi:diguanylate cyclase (GGDEF)-like protein
VQQVLRGGRNVVELNSGVGRPDHPAWYSQAYVPVVNDGKVIGVVEVLGDQTRARAGMQQAYGRVALTAALLALALALVAGWRDWRRRRAQRHADAQLPQPAAQGLPGGALDRASFAEAVEQSVARHTPDGGGLALLRIDLDRFKAVNDAFGRAAGDQVLRGVTLRLRELVRHGDPIARLDGDEFAVLQHGVAGPADVSGLAQRIVRLLAEPHDIGGGSVVCAASVGAAVFGTDATHAPDLLHKADLALCRAKSGGLGGVSFYDAALDQQLQARRELVHDLRRAIAHEALALHYQPQYAADGQSLLGYEALLRWTHATRGNVPPGEFITVAEDNALIEPLGAWVLRRACQEAATWPSPLSVSVNLSARQFRSDELLATVAAALHESGLAPHRLELEISEALFMSNADRVLRLLRSLSATGVRIALDDFGTGPSSLACLWRLPLDKLKIGRTCTHGLGADPQAAVIVRSVVALAHALAVRVNAGGVETAAQLGALQELGCDEVQGFLLGRPIPADTLSHRGAVAAPPQCPSPRPSGWPGLANEAAAP